MDLSKIKQLVDLIAGARAIVGLTGAGISTESGIPDYRTPGGLWSRFKPIDFKDFMASEQMRVEAWSRKFALDDAVRAEVGEPQPNAGHYWFADLVKRGKMTTIITQNIDGLHSAAGVAPEHLIELHGNGTYAKCLTCEAHHSLDWVRDWLEAEKSTPRCSHCGGLVKSGTISFGQSLSPSVLKAAEAATLACDLFIVMGSSLVVYPAAAFPALAAQNGTPLIIINKDATPIDNFAELLINESISEVLNSIQLNR